MIKRIAFALATALLTIIALDRPASAHPHVWVKAATEVVYAADGSVSAIRHAWTFDDLFSTYALQGIETKTKGVFTRDELAALAQTNVESLKEFGFFTFAKADGRKQRFVDPVDYYLEYKDAALVLHFTLPLKSPVKSKNLALEIYDPTYFVDFSLQKADPVRLVGAPGECALAIQRPGDGTATVKKLGEDNFLTGDNANIGDKGDAATGGNVAAMFANKITVECP